jgi:hypothetical protein
MNLLLQVSTQQVKLLEIYSATKKSKADKIFDSHRDPAWVKIGENHQKVTAA